MRNASDGETPPPRRTRRQAVKLTDERPGARFKRGDEKIEIIDHGAELFDGRMRRWVDYQRIEGGAWTRGPVRRATADDPVPGWRRVRPGHRPDYHLECDDETGEMELVPTTALGRDWCRDMLGSAGGGALTDTDAVHVLTEAKARGLQCGSQALLEMFLGGVPVEVNRAGPSLQHIAMTMAYLRRPEGCEWCRKQTTRDLRDSVLKEAHETIRAIDRNDPAELQDELADLLLQVVFLARIAHEEEQFDLHDVLATLDRKLVDRHPHVFDRDPAAPRLTAEQVRTQREALKAKERAAKGGEAGGLLASVPGTLPALLRATDVNQRVKAAGLNAGEEAWTALGRAVQALNKLENSVSIGRTTEAIERDAGRTLLHIATAVQVLGGNAEQSLHRAVDEVVADVEAIEKRLAANGLTMLDATRKRLEAEWRKAARADKE